MTGFTPELVERVAQQWFSHAQKAVPDWRFRPNWQEISDENRDNYRDDVAFILEASGIAELTEALRELTDIAQSAVHDDARGDEAAAIFAARDLLAKYCPVPPLPYPPHHRSVMDALAAMTANLTNTSLLSGGDES